MDTRRTFVPQGVDEHIEIDDLDSDPFSQFHKWFSSARESGIPDANAMILATSTRDGMPSARTVLMKGLDDRGLVFYTNYESQKGRELAENPRAAAVFYWYQLSRQIRLSGDVERVTPEQSLAYFSSRHRGSQLGAWASRQSEPLESRRELLTRVAEIDSRYPGDDIPLPPHWGGYRLIPHTLEFWESRESRLHDRFRYTRRDDGTWQIERLQP